jgi:hypothetical protein
MKACCKQNLEQKQKQILTKFPWFGFILLYEYQNENNVIGKDKLRMRRWKTMSI